MIRYRTHDMTKLTTEPCSCGRTHVRILRVTGRNDDMMIIRGVNVYPSQIESVLVGFPNTAPHYLLIIRREGIMDTLDIEVEADPELDFDQYPALAAEVRHHIKSIVGISCNVLIKEP